jgi:hypothetical protein
MTKHELYDDILKLCSTKAQPVENLRKKYVDQSNLEGILLYLSNIPPGYLSNTGQTYSLTPVGKAFLDSGGYVGHAQREAEEILAKQQEKELIKRVNESVLDTNESVRKTHDFQKQTTKLMLVITICAVVISLLNLIVNAVNIVWQPKQPTELLLSQQRQMQKQIDSLQFLIISQASLDTVQKKHP